MSFCLCECVRLCVSKAVCVCVLGSVCTCVCFRDCVYVCPWLCVHTRVGVSACVFTCQINLSQLLQGVVHLSPRKHICLLSSQFLILPFCAPFSLSLHLLPLSSLLPVYLPVSPPPALSLSFSPSHCGDGAAFCLHAQREGGSRGERGRGRGEIVRAKGKITNTNRTGPPPPPTPLFG